MKNKEIYQVSSGSFINNYQDIKKITCDECDKPASYFNSTNMKGYPKLICHRHYYIYLTEINEQQKIDNQF